MFLFAFLLFMLFLIMQAQDIIDWSFWWISAPLWGWFLFAVCALIEYSWWTGRAKRKRAEHKEASL